MHEPTVRGLVIGRSLFIRRRATLPVPSSRAADRVQQAAKDGDERITPSTRRHPGRGDLEGVVDPRASGLDLRGLSVVSLFPGVSAPSIWRRAGRRARAVRDRCECQH